MVDPKDLVEEPPEEEGIDRRSFVKGCLGAATIGAVGAAGFGLFKQVAVVKETTTRFIEYFGAKVLTGSPAPRGLPYIPLALDEDGETIIGVPEHLDWYRFCAHEQAPGLANEGFTDDNKLYVNITEDKLHGATQDVIDQWWYLDKRDQPLKMRDFIGRDVDTGAPFRWRSEGQRGNDMVTGIILLLDRERVKAKPELEEFAIMDERLGDGVLVAFNSFCTHFCCVPGYHEDTTAEKYDAWDKIFCTCHNSRYDPYEIVDYDFTLVLGTEAEKAGGGGGGH
ncbi:MAG: Rieske 2Fe-2S domain-containing protein [Euryarchaeota archaeon]|nr:Rieske 2Fe-2S domain-containing protein [Euryarchaeota archaeon]